VVTGGSCLQSGLWPLEAQGQFRRAMESAPVAACASASTATGSTTSPPATRRRSPSPLAEANAEDALVRSQHEMQAGHESRVCGTAHLFTSRASLASATWSCSSGKHGMPLRAEHADSALAGLRVPASSVVTKLTAAPRSPSFSGSSGSGCCCCCGCGCLCRPANREPRLSLTL